MSQPSKIPAAEEVARVAAAPSLSRREVMALLSALPLAAAAASCARHGEAAPTVTNGELLQPAAHYLLPLGAVKPQGWLREQLRIQADGLTGHLDEFWESVDPKTSGWRGGAGESWERGPYYLDGLVPLAYLLEDEKLIEKAKAWVSWTIENQRENGSIGPDQKKGTYAREWQAKDWWPNMVMLKVLTQYYEASGDERVIPLMEKYLLHHLENAETVPLVEWAAMRWAEEVLAIVYVYNRTGNAKLLDLARILHSQAYDWKAHFADFQFPGKVSKDQAKLPTHVVNNAMAMKTAAVYWQVSGDPTDRDSIYRILEAMDEHHLMPGGVHSGDEHYAGNSPVQGTELCAVVEGMFSYEALMAILGDPRFGDRLERAAYNALPATLSGDMWTHQYDQQPNQVLCTKHRRDWTTNGPDSNLFGLEPNFGCCTANYHQGWPKLVSQLWMATPDGGLAAVAWGPCEVTAPVSGGGKVRIVEETGYPFDGAVTLTLHLESPAEFPMRLRIPAWATGASATVNGENVPGLQAGEFLRMARRWNDGDVVELRFPMALRTSRWFNNSVAIERGPLVFALDVGTEWKKLRDAGMSADYELHATSAWNYALELDPDKAPMFTTKAALPGKMPFSAEGAPVRIEAQARKLPGWTMQNASAAPPPQSPVKSAQPVESITLIPYGSAKLRITEFPWIAPGSPG